MPHERLEARISDTLAKDFGSISAVKYAKDLGYEIGIQPHHTGNVVPLTSLLDHARAEIIMHTMYHKRRERMHGFINDASQQSIDKAMELMTEYEFVHYLRVHVQTISQIEHKGSIRFEEEPEEDDLEPFYIDSPEPAIRNLSRKDQEWKKDAIELIRVLYALEVAYVNTLSQVVYWSDAWKNKVIPKHDHWGKGYFEDMAERRMKLLEDPSNIEKDLEKNVGKFLSSIKRQ